jgi:hypothetical protein
MKSTIISIISLCISLLTAWFTIFYRGKVKCTHPAFIAFRYDILQNKVPQAKIFLRILLYSTGKRGLVIENLFLKVREGERVEEFSFWGYGDKELVVGSGLFVGETGHVANHHFNPMDCEKLFRFRPGNYDIELFAKLVGRNHLTKLIQIPLNLPFELISDNKLPSENAIYFRWSPEQEKYIASVEKNDDSMFWQVLK